MTLRIKLKNSVVKDKAPVPGDLEVGELAINAHQDSPAAYIKDAAGAVRKIAGVGSVSTPAASDTVQGIVELATAAEVTTGIDATRAVTPAGLKVELDKKAPLASPALTGTPTAPTAAVGTNTTQLATTAFVGAAVTAGTPAATTAASGLVQLADAAAVTAGTAGRVVDAAQLKAAVAAEDLWDRAGTEISPKTAGDSVFTSGAVKVGGTTAAPSITLKADGGIVANTFGSGLIYDAATKRLGLGTNPDTELHISRATAGRVIARLADLDSRTTELRSPDNAGSLAGVGTVTNHPFAIFQNDTTAIYVDYQKRVGIGTAAPDSTLTVKGATGATPLQISGPSSEFCRVTSDGNFLLGGTLPASPNITLKASGQAAFGDVLGLGRTERLQVQGSLLAYGDGQGFFASNDSNTGGCSFMSLSGANSGGVISSINGPLNFNSAHGLNAQLTKIGDFLLGGTLPASPNITLGANGVIDATNYRLKQNNVAVGYYAYDSQGGLPTQGQIVVSNFGNNGASSASLATMLSVGATAWTPYTSESRLKDIQSDADADQCWNLVRDIELKRYYYKDQDDKSGVSYMGPMADWLGLQDPELLIDTGRTDEHGKIHTYNQGLLDMKALAALSAALKRIEALETRLAALEPAAPHKQADPGAK